MSSLRLILRAALAAACFLTILAPATALATTQSWDATRSVVSNSGSDASFPNVAIAANGDAAAGWAQSGGPWVAYAPVGQPFGTPTELEQFSGFTLPEVALDPAGNLFAVWANPNDGTLRFSERTHDGGVWSVPVTLDTAASPVFGVAPVIATGPDGSVIVAYSMDHVAKVLARSSGGTWSSPAVLDDTRGSGNQTYAAFVRVRFGPTGDAYIVWDQVESGIGHVEAVRYDRASSTFGAFQKVADGPDSEQIYFALAVAPDGSAIASWDQTVGIASQTLESARSSTSGTWSGTATPGDSVGAYDNGNNDIHQMAIGIRPDSTAVALWYRIAGGVATLRTATAPPGGTFGTATDVAGITPSADPGMTEVTDGGLLALYGEGNVIRAMIAPAGGVFGSPVDLTPSDEPLAGFGEEVISAASNPSGDTVAAWSRSDGSNQRVEATRYAGPPPAATTTTGSTPPPPPATTTDSTPPPPAPPASVPTPRPTTPAPVPVPTAAQVIDLPASRVCVSRRSFVIHLRVPAGVTATGAKVSLTGRPAKTIKGRALTAPIDLRGLPKGTFTVSVRVTLKGGRALNSHRTYHTCAPKHRG